MKPLAILLSVWLYPLVWALEATAAGLLGGALWGWGIAVLGPGTAYLAMRFQEQRKHFFEQARAYFLLNTRNRIRAALEQRLARLTVAGPDASTADTAPRVCR